jgi:hypothetical protein
MKQKLQQIGLILLLAPVAPLAGLMLSWWLAYALLPENRIGPATLTGLAAGLLFDILLLPRLFGRINRLGLPFWIPVFIFYTIGIFGMFMGVPVVNAALAVPAGFVIGAQLAARQAGAAEVKTASTRTSVFTTVILALICAASAVIALRDPYTAANLEGMLALPFAVTPAMIWSLILIGGAALLIANWILTVLSVRLTHRWLRPA